MAAVVGVGAIIIYSAEPEPLAAWYRRHLGIDAQAQPDRSWTCFLRDPATGRLVPFGILPAPPAVTEARDGRGAVMVNYAVADLAALLTHLGAAGVAVEGQEESAQGRFAWLSDPDGNPVELWQAP